MNIWQFLTAALLGSKQLGAEGRCANPAGPFPRPPPTAPRTALCCPQSTFPPRQAREGHYHSKPCRGESLLPTWKLSLTTLQPRGTVHQLPGQRLEPWTDKLIRLKLPKAHLAHGAGGLCKAFWRFRSWLGPVASHTPPYEILGNIHKIGEQSLSSNWGVLWSFLLCCSGF